MSKSRTFESRFRRLTAAAVLSTAALLSVAACAGQSSPSAQGSTDSSTSAAATVPASSAPATVSLPAATASASSSTLASASCGNTDLQVKWGYGSQSDPQQYAAVDFVNISGHPCTLYGYPGIAIKVDGTVVNATRTLDGAEPPLKSAQVVTLKPGATVYAVVQWKLNTPGEACDYPIGSGTFEATAPNTTRTVVLSSGVQIGGPGTINKQGICSGFAVSPVEAGSWGIVGG
jgi:hypothetical protein